jgi:ubiquinone/menaquinone biosynthesis C-methylase UbiE
MGAHYDRIGVGYAAVRQPDVRLAAMITTALGVAATVVNVGAGAGSSEPAGRTVVSVEPSAVMLAQHPGRRRVRAMAETLPFPAGAFDASMAVMTTHHWPDLRAGLAEMSRVAARRVVFTWDPGWHRVLWVVEEYVPEIGELERSRFTPIDQVADVMGARIRTASSTFASLPDSIVVPAMDRLRQDLDSGAWQERHRNLLDADAIDYGYRLLIAG